MKKYFFTATALTFVIAFAQAQTKLTQFGLFDDFSSTSEYIADSASHRSLHWWTSYNEQKITRDSANKQLQVKMTQGAYQYHAFGVSFGDSNGTATGGENTIDLSGNGKFSFDITNTGTQGISIRVACIDLQNRQVDCIGGATNFGDIWKYQTQIQVLAGTTVTFEAGTPNGAGGGVINTCDFTTGVWGDYEGGHIIRTDCDLKHIKAINLTVLNAAKNPGDGHALALTDGRFSISNFSVGDTSANATTAVTPTISIPVTAVELPDTAKSNAMLNITASGTWTAKSNKSWLTVKLYNSTTGVDSVKLTVAANSTTYARTATVTFSAKYATSQTITVTQAAGKGTGIDANRSDMKSYHIVGNTIFFDNDDIRVYTILGHLLSTAGNSSITLQTGIYILKSPQGSEKIEIIKQ